MQSDFFDVEKNSLNNNMEIQSCAAAAAQKEKSTVDEHQNFNELRENDEDLENNVVYSDSDDGDQFINSFEEEYDVQLSSSNSDNDQRWYAYRGRWGINVLDQNPEVNNGGDQIENHAPQQQPQPRNNNINNAQQQQQQQEEEETDFLEMDFEPDTNSEIYENENEARFANFDHNNQLPIHIPENSALKSTGAKPKQFLKSPKPHHQQHVSFGDNIFRITGHLNSNESSTLKQQQQNEENVYNVGASCSSYQNSHHHHHDLLKPHKSPSKSSHHSHKQQRLHEAQNDQFLFELEPLKLRNSVTIYTSNCDEKILMDALTSLKLKPDREMIMKYFNSSKPSPEMKLVDYIIYRSKMGCNYLKLIELIENACRNNDDDEEYGIKKFDINFYPLDFFSTTPEMIDIEVSEIVKRWTPQTDLKPLVYIKNKYFVQTNVLGKLVNIIRRINNQKPLAIFKENETIKIPQFYVSGYITITLNRNPT